MKNLIHVLGAIVVSLTSISAQATETGQNATVVELFTSQGCYTCPAADALLGKLITSRPEVIALEFHVDYWDDLVYGSAGVWKDPYSKAKYSDRQRRYNSLGPAGRRGVYTPQMMINGRYALVGTDRDDLYTSLRRAENTPLQLSVLDQGADWKLEIAGNASQAGNVWRVDYLRFAETPVPSGENKGKSLQNHNIVTSMTEVAQWQNGVDSLILSAIAPEQEFGCAILVQSNDGRLLGAAHCP
ncbi:MAG: hypothetical protein ACI8P9_004359 [Parasphingorhabdus sp.]|jgi:hypothetical protein